MQSDPQEGTISRALTWLLRAHFVACTLYERQALLGKSEVRRYTVAELRLVSCKCFHATSKSSSPVDPANPVDEATSFLTTSSSD